jgi:nucleoside-diphosphate-sugar epimerase
MSQPMQPQAQPICLVSGTGGYLGGRVKAAFERRGWKVIELTRQPRPGSSAIAFQLGRDVDPAVLSGARALVHCAYDFKQLTAQDLQRVNVAGSEKLLRAAREAGIEKLIYISSISAFDECRSLYGKTKLATEKIARSLNAIVIRPGLIYSEQADAMFGRLIHQVEHARMLPLFGGGRQIQYLVHEQDVAEFICRCAEGTLNPPPAPVTIAHDQPWTFRQILEEIARAKGKKISFVPVPWRLLWAIIKTAELCGVRLNFRSDSLVSLMYQNPNPSFGPLRDLGFTCRPFQMKIESGKVGK